MSKERCRRMLRVQGRLSEMESYWMNDLNEVTAVLLGQRETAN